MTDRDLQGRLAIARRAARVAGDYLKQAQWDDHEVSHKGRYDLSLSADAIAGTRIAEIVQNAFPGEGWVEEDGPDATDAEWFWIIDPLDGTVNYHHRLPWYCVSVSCYHKTEDSEHPLWRYGEPVASVVYAPSWDQEFWALKDEGAWSGPRRLSVTDEPLERCLLSFSRGSKPEDQQFMRNLIDRLGATARKTRSHGAAALDLALVAQGSLGAHLQRSLQPWDVAAGLHLISEAGGLAIVAPADEGHHVLAAGASVFEVLKKEWP